MTSVSACSVESCKDSKTAWEGVSKQVELLTSSFFFFNCLKVEENIFGVAVSEDSRAHMMKI